MQPVANEFNNPVLKQMVGFLREIGLDVVADNIDVKTFMPGIHVHQGCMYIDEEKLSYPGDVLHEAGHMAIFTTERRKSITYDFAGDGGDEMAASPGRMLRHYILISIPHWYFIPMVIKAMRPGYWIIFSRENISVCQCSTGWG